MIADQIDELIATIKPGSLMPAKEAAILLRNTAKQSYDMGRVHAMQVLCEELAQPYVGEHLDKSMRDGIAMVIENVMRKFKPGEIV